MPLCLQLDLSEGLEICGNFSNGACAALRNEAASGWFVVRHHTSFAVARTVVVAVCTGRAVCPPGPSGASVISRVPMSSLSCTFRRLFALMKTWTAVPRGHCRLDSVLQEQFFPSLFPVNLSVPLFQTSAPVETRAANNALPAPFA